jgi:hypothetical protein
MTSRNSTPVAYITQDDDLFEQCDALGILVLPGICCCDAWQSWDVWTDATHKLAAESLRSQVKRLRRFPSMTTFLYSSDQMPPPDVEQSYLEVFKTERWQTGLISSASYLNSTLTGVSGVKMAGPYGTYHAIPLKLTRCGVSWQLPCLLRTSYRMGPSELLVH